MPFETYSNELNAALGGGFDGRMSCIIGGHRTGKTQMAIDIVERFLNSHVNQSVVVVTHTLQPWVEAFAGTNRTARLHVATSLKDTRGGSRALTIIECQLGMPSNFSVNGREYVRLSDGLVPPAPTLFIAPRLAEQPKTFDHVVSLSVDQDQFWAKIIKNRDGPLASNLNITRREFVTAQLKDRPTALDVIAGDEFDSI